jgi:hypothetical protein
MTRPLQKSTGAPEFKNKGALMEYPYRRNRDCPDIRSFSRWYNSTLKQVDVKGRMESAAVGKSA